ncbi:MAG TPA: PLP-dependent aminotransferase family protein [Thermoanaerobaculia bacterium]|nr:PLP-dependent aminotransferase family protein [Thermoanaerobaculia bacterium]
MPKRARGITPVTLSVRRRGSKPLDVQVAAGLRAAILSHKLRGGMRLPSTRAMAEQLNVSRNTVVAAFEQLVAEGYLESHVGDGTHVVERTIDAKPALQSAITKARLSKRGKIIASIPVQLSPFHGPLLPFRACTPSVADFPIALWGRLLAKRWRRASAGALDYGEPQGALELRNAIADYARATRGVACEADQVFIVSCTQQAMDLVARMLLDPGDAVWFEDPGYSGARSALRAAGAQLVPVPVDDEGIDVAEGKRRAPRARLAYVTPSHQFPLGTTMSLQRRTELLAWARRANAFVIEDDYDSEFQYVHRPLPALQGMDANGRVIYVGTFSKLMFPSLRVAYMILPRELVAPFRSARFIADGYTAAVPQLALADFIRDGHFERHVRRMRAIYHERRDVLLSALHKHLAGALDVEPTNGGMHLTAWLAPRCDDAMLAKKAAKHGLDLLPLSAFALRRKRRGAILLGYAAFRPRELEDGVRRLKMVL